MKGAPRTRPVAEAAAPERVVDLLERVGGMEVQVHGDEGKGEIVLVPADGGRLVLRLEGGRLAMEWSGERLELRAPSGTLALAARRVELRGEELHIESERDLRVQSGNDLELRADHHVNLWGLGVKAGD